MNLKELKALIAQEKIRSIVESKLSEATVFARGQTFKDADTDINGSAIDMTSTDTPRAQSQVKVDPAVVYHAKKQLFLDAEADDLGLVNVDPTTGKPSKSTDLIKNGAKEIMRHAEPFQKQPAYENSTVDPKEVLEYLIWYLVEPHSAKKIVKPYFEYLKSKDDLRTFEKSDETESVKNLTTPTVVARAPKKIKELDSLHEAIKNIKSVLKKQ